MLALSGPRPVSLGGEPLVIPLLHTPRSVLSPVSAYLNMLSVVPAPPDCPLFVLPPDAGFGPQPIVYDWFQKVFKLCVQSVGVDPSSFSSHSFRRGGTTFAFESGASPDLIKKQGDWKSDCYQRYVDDSVTKRAMVSKLMSTRLGAMF